MKPIVVLGTGGHGRETLEVIEAMNAERPRHEILGFLDDRPAVHGTTVAGLSVLGGREWLLQQSSRGIALAVGLGNPAPRAGAVDWALRNGLAIPRLIHPTCHRSSRSAVADGVMLMAGARVSASVKVKAYAHVNVDCSLSHDCSLGPFATLGPGVHLAGGVTVEEGCHMGVGALAIPDVTVGAWSVIGAGAVVVRDVPPNSVVVGVPGRVTRTLDEGWQQHG